MHEMAIAQQIVGIVEDTLRSHPNAKCKTVHVRIGELTAVIPESLTFAYQAITTDTPLSESILKIKSMPILAECKSCLQKFGIKDFDFLCPFCQSQDLEVRQGKELHVEKLELDE
ncbi:hydrogenase maturation nickel metallochaperone HypA [candidate division KSB1 bacterium]|nr:hydrogenase maturation nickel metallochaperone HypA [candidate division KSB1 bacterium]